MERISRIMMMLAMMLTMVLPAGADDSIRFRSCRIRTVSQQENIKMRKIKNATTSWGERLSVRNRGAEENPMVGNRRQLVVLVAFADKDFTIDDPRPTWNRILNEVELNEAPFVGSVHDYFADQSYGKLQLTFDLHYIKLADNEQKYRSTYEDDNNSKYLVADIVDSLVQRGFDDWEPYDWDGNGDVDQLLVIFAGKGMNWGGGSNTIWPHQWWLSFHEDFTAKTVRGRDKDYEVDSYCCVQEIGGSATYGDVFGTLCHEYSHCLGLPDLYYGSTSYVGEWDLMCRGNYNADGLCPPNYSAMERMLMGWIDATLLETPTSITGMEALGDQPEAYMICNDGTENEFYVIENRQQQKWDEQLPGSGLVVFHIDYDEDIWWQLTDYVNQPGKLCYTIFPANNQSSVSKVSGWAYPYMGNDSLTNLSAPAAVLNNPNVDGSLLMSKPITQMSVEGGLASFDFMGGTGAAITDLSTEASSPAAIYDLQGRQRNEHALPPGIYIIKDVNGKSRKLIVKILSPLPLKGESLSSPLRGI